MHQSSLACYWLEHNMLLDCIIAYSPAPQDYLQLLDSHL